MQVTLVYATAPDRQVAATIANAAVEAHLAACVNIMPEVQSHYRWDGKTECAQETPLLLKTTEARLNELMELIRSLHPYECPCIVAWTASAGNPAFMEWIVTSTK